MAEQNSNGQEKTEQATPKRREDARKKGDVPRSRELTTSGVMLASSAALLTLGPSLGERLVSSFAAGFAFERQTIFEADAMASSLAGQATHALGIMLPLGVVVVIAAFAFSVILGGVSFSGKALAPKLERISIPKGFKRMFGVKALVELSKSLAKVALIVIVAVAWLYSISDDVLRMSDMPIGQALLKACWLSAMSLLVVSSALIVGAVIDVPWQLFEYSKKLKMTRQEVRDEMKETDGKPEVRQRIRQLQQEVATRRMMEAVPYADVIITNPTHFAVALRYNESRMIAPEVVAKGQDLVAARIREIAGEHKVALFSAPPLARALFHSTKVGQKIPAGLYTAVAQVLAYVFQLRDGSPGSNALKPPVPVVDESLYTRRGRSRRG